MGMIDHSADIWQLINMLVKEEAMPEILDDGGALILFILFLLKMTEAEATKGKHTALSCTYCLSANDPTTVPQIMEEPKPAMNRRPMSFTLYP